VEPWEAYLTLGFFFALILMAYIADCLRRRTVKAREDLKYGHGHDKTGPTAEGKRPVDLGNIANFEAVDFYKILLPQEAGQKAKDAEEEKVSTEMKEFLM